LKRLIEQCYNLKDRYERVNDKIEVKRMNSIAEKAAEYRSELQKLLDLNFDNPSQELKEFAYNNKMDLKEPKVQKHFLEIRKKYLDDINKFYESNFSNFNNQKSNLSKDYSKNRKNKINKMTNSINPSNNIQGNILKSEFKSKDKNKADNKNKPEREFLKKKPNNKQNSIISNLKNNISPLIFIGILIISLIYYST